MGQHDRQCDTETDPPHLSPGQQERKKRKDERGGGHVKVMGGMGDICCH